MKNIKFFLFLLIFLLTSNKLMANNDKSIYDFNFVDIDGNLVELSTFMFSFPPEVPIPFVCVLRCTKSMLALLHNRIRRNESSKIFHCCDKKGSLQCAKLILVV